MPADIAVSANNLICNQCMAALQRQDERNQDPQVSKGSRSLSKSRIGTHALSTDNCKPIAITFNNPPENIRSQTKFSSFKNLFFRHFMSHAWPYFRHLTDNSFAVSHLNQPLYWTVSPLFVSFYYFLVTSWKTFERMMLLDNKSISLYIKG